MGLGLCIGAAVAAAVFALIYSIGKARSIGSMQVESSHLVQISGYIAEGARAFLSREYRVIAYIAPIIILLLAVFNTGSCGSGGRFRVGSPLLGPAGWFGMSVATKANARTPRPRPRVWGGDLVAFPAARSWA
jgi:K(+)-stimulated pyrophosphate-energized sodium pump